MFSKNNGIKLGVSNRTGKFINWWKLNNILWKKSIDQRKKIKSWFLNTERKENQNTTYQNLRDAAKAVLRETFMCVNAYNIKKEERYQISNLILHLKKLEEEQTKSEANRRKEIIKIWAEMSEIKKQNQQNHNLVAWKIINKICKYLARLTKKKKEKTKILEMRNESGDITANFTEIKRIREYYEQLYANKLDKLYKMTNS